MGDKTLSFLIADPQPSDQVDYYLIEIDGDVVRHDPQRDDATSQVRMHYDLEGLPLGDHIFRATACNEWGESGWSVPFEFKSSLPPVPGGLGLSQE